MAGDPQVFELNCGLQEYAWGKQGESSLAAALKAKADPTFRLNPSKYYAELWMGTHPNRPSMVIRPGYQEKALWEWVHENPDCLGSYVKEYFRGTLPFLFKVLSVRTALSVQAHPNKVQAEELHSKFPDIYRDRNHKPELAIALTEFKGLCGFRPVKEVAGFLQSIEELRMAVGAHKAIKLMTSSCSSDEALQRVFLKECFSSLFREDPIVKEQLKHLVQRVQDTKERGDDLTPLEGDIILELHKEFPGDTGAFCVYFLNVVCLQPGEAMFLEAKMPHAYLSGDCMECSTSSDNVVRAGLTKKFIDKRTLVEMLDYKARNVKHTKFMGIEDHYKGVETTMFRPDIPDFGVTQYQVRGCTDQIEIFAMDSASICIVVHGEGCAWNKTVPGSLKLCTGTVFFIAALQEVMVQVTGKEGMMVFRAHAGLVPPPPSCQEMQQQQWH